MRRFRNPKFAPEALERKLNPSTAIGIQMMADVAIDSAQQTNDFARSDILTVSYDMTTRSEPMPHPVPGDPEPLTPGPDATAPKPGNGDPPLSDPSLPGGGGGPA